MLEPLVWLWNSGTLGGRTEKKEVMSRDTCYWREHWVPSLLLFVPWTPWGVWLSWPSSSHYKVVNHRLKSNIAKKPWAETFEIVSPNKPLVFQLTQARVVRSSGTSSIMKWTTTSLAFFFLDAQNRWPVLLYPTVIAEVSERQLTSWAWGSRDSCAEKALLSLLLWGCSLVLWAHLKLEAVGLWNYWNLLYSTVI